MQSNIVEINGKPFNLPLDISDYWKKRANHDLYRLTVALAAGLFRDARSAIDVGCYTSGLIVELDWIGRRVASDLSAFVAPNWEHVSDVEFVAGDAFQLDFGEQFDLVLSNQTIEHVEDPSGFVEKLLSIGRGLIISTTYETPAGMIKGHIQDPISFEKFRGWFPCELDCWLICHNPYRNIKHIIAAIRQSHPART